MLSRTLTAVVSVAVAADEALQLLQTQVRAHRAKDTFVMQEEGDPEEVIEEAPRRAIPADYDVLGQVKSEVANLKFTRTKYRNLGGMGPHKAQPPNVRYATVARTATGDAVDMILEAENYKTANPSKTGLYGASAVVNIHNGNEVDFTARFVDAKTDEPVNMMAFHLSFMDIDTGKVAGEEALTIGGFDKSYLLDETELIQVEMDDGRTKFHAGEPGVEADNPSDPLLLTDIQAKRTVSFQFPAGLSKFTFTYKVAEVAYENWKEKGRHFAMSGMSSLYFCEAKPVVVDYNMASVAYSNLGGQGPDFGSPSALLFRNVAAVENDQMLDLKIENLTKYSPFNTSQNGLNGEFAQVNIGAGTKTKFRFTFLKQGTDEPYQMAWNMFTIFDLDHGRKDDKYQETVEINGFATHYLTESSELHLTEHGKNWYTYGSSTWGTGEDNPRDPMNLTQQQKDRSVSMLFHNRSSYDAAFAAAKPKNGGRNFLFSGKSALVFC